MSTKCAVIYADGGSRGNPGPSGAGALVKDKEPEGTTIGEVTRFLGINTNNFAEYTSLIIGLEKALELGVEIVEVRMDSELIVKQMLGQYRVKNQNLKPLYETAKSLSRKFSEFHIVHIERALNKEADKLANQAMDRGA